LTDALARARGTTRPLYLPWLERPFTAVVNRLAERRGTAIGYVASLLKVFMPYLVWNTVFDNTRVVEELGRTPPPFSEYCYPLYVFSTTHRFTYPYREWPQEAEAALERILMGAPCDRAHGGGDPRASS
jgi:hypothetical protein